MKRLGIVLLVAGLAFAFPGASPAAMPMNALVARKRILKKSVTGSRAMRPPKSPRTTFGKSRCQFRPFGSSVLRRRYPTPAGKPPALRR